MTTTTYSTPNYPSELFSFTPRLIDTVDEVVVNHQNTGYAVLEALQAKLGTDNEPVRNVGGLQFDPTGRTDNPAEVGEPVLWVDSSSGPGFKLKYTNDVGVTITLGEGGGGGGGTLSDSYNFGGPGAGRVIVADSGSVEIVNFTSDNTVLHISQDHATANVATFENNSTSGTTLNLTGSVPYHTIATEDNDLHIVTRQTTTGGDLKLDSSGELTLTDKWLTSPVPLAASNATSLNTYAQSIIGAINELQATGGGEGGPLIISDSGFVIFDTSAGVSLVAHHEDGPVGDPHGSQQVVRPLTLSSGESYVYTDDAGGYTHIGHGFGMVSFQPNSGDSREFAFFTYSEDINGAVHVILLSNSDDVALSDVPDSFCIIGGSGRITFKSNLDTHSASPGVGVLWMIQNTATPTIEPIPES